MGRKQILVVSGGAVSLFFLWLALREQAWRDIVVAFGRADYRWLLPAALLIMADYALRAWRWGIILRPAAQRTLPFRTLFPVLLLGFAANNVLPARAGELWRMWGLAQRTGLRKTVALGTLVVERVFDGLTLLFLLALAGLAHPLSGQAQMVQGVLSVLFGLVFLGLLLLLFMEEWTLRMAARLMWPIPDEWRTRLVGVLGRFAMGLHALRQPRALLEIGGSSLLAWGCQGLSFAVLLIAFDVRLPAAELFSAAILMLTLINLLILIPAGPGNVGTFEAAGRLALTIGGVLVGQGERATALVLATHMLQWLLVTGLGLLVAAQEGINIAGLRAGPKLEAE